MSRPFIGKAAVAAAAAAALLLAACKKDGPDPYSKINPPAPPPVAGPRSYDVEPCLVQPVSPGKTVAILTIPDTLTIDFSLPSRFPNGRALPDPVADFALAMLFLDLTKHPIDSFHKLPLNPPANDRPFRAAFPYLAPPQGNPPIETAGGSSYNFRTDPESAYVRVDRTGFPALATALVSAPQRNAFNDDSAAQDLTYKWVPEFAASLTALMNALGDDIEAAGFKLCARLK